MYKYLTCYIICFLVFTNCKSQNDTPKVVVVVKEQSWFQPDSLLQHVKTLSSDAFKGRRTGTEGAFMAKKYIVNTFKRLSIDSLSHGYEQKFTFKNGSKTYQASNVLGYVKGTEFPEKYIVISAHYDHEGVKRGEIYNGADDDASGISALFAFAEYFKKYPPKHSVILAAFDAEELGLKGSKYFVENPIVNKDALVLNLNMDMISRSNKNELFAVGTRYNKHLEPAIIDFESTKNLTLKIGHDGSDNKDDWTHASDHAPFHIAKIPFIYFGVEDHADYHQPTDDFENIHPNFYQNTVTAIISIFEVLDSSKL